MRTIRKILLKLLSCTMTLFIIFSCFSFAIVTADEGNEETHSIYLTFDDGPSNVVTDKILDVLKEKNIKATFFVVGSKIKDRERILKRMHEEGHSIGLHSYTHISKKVYADHQSFIDEMKKTDQEIYNVIDIHSKIIRFPGGSKFHLDKQLLNKLHQNDYRVFDWNACIPDGVNNQASIEVLYRESKKVVGSGKNIIMLLHCDQTNENTFKALPKIIEYYQSKGYVFRTITEETPEFYFRFN